MCTPALLIAGGVAGNAYGAYQGAQAQKSAENYNADIAARNAKIDSERARDAVLKGQYDVFRKGLETAQQIGTMQAAYASRGVDISSGSPMRILTDTSYIGHLDMSTLGDNAAKEAAALNLQAGADYRASEFHRKRAASIDPWKQAGLSLLGGAGQVASSNYASSHFTGNNHG